MGMSWNLTFLRRTPQPTRIYYPTYDQGSADLNHLVFTHLVCSCKYHRTRRPCRYYPAGHCTRPRLDSWCPSRPVGIPRHRCTGKRPSCSRRHRWSRRQRSGSTHRCPCRTSRQPKARGLQIQPRKQSR